MGDTDLSRFGKVRIEALTDGIFAIAMTVLVLDLRPHAEAGFSEGQVLQSILHLLPSFVAFVASFITLGMYWVSHHGLFRFLMQTDRTILWLNMFFLMFVSLVPFTTALYAGEDTSRVANSVFGANLILMGLLSYATWSYARRHGHVAEEADSNTVRFVTGRILTPPLIASLGLLLSLFQPEYAEYVYLSMIPLFVVAIPRIDPKKIKKSGNTFPPPSSSNQQSPK